MNLGELIKQYRTEHSMSQDDFSARSGLSKAYISMLESNKNYGNGKAIAPSYSTFQKVSKATGRSVKDIIAEMDDKQMCRINTAAKALDYNADELLEGIEKKTHYISNIADIALQSDPFESSSQSKSEITAESELLKLFRSFNEDGQTEVLKHTRYIASQPEYKKCNFTEKLDAAE